MVTGRVQGVFFRASVQQQAQLLNITGHARNLFDGNVEVLACGAEKDVGKLCDYLWQGPLGARVSDVKCEVANEISPANFSTG